MSQVGVFYCVVYGEGVQSSNFHIRFDRYKRHDDISNQITDEKPVIGT